MTESLEFLGFVLIAGAVAHLIVRQRPGAETGAFWAQVLDRTSVFIALPLLLVSALHTYQPVEDRLPSSAGWWLFIPGLLWAIVLTLGVMRPPAPESGRWIAGILGFSPRRYWVLLFAIPFLPALYFLTYPLAYPWTDNIYAGHWGILWLFFAALLGIGFSTSPASAARANAAASVTGETVLPPWPEEMEGRGIALRPICDFQATAAAEIATAAASEWQKRIAVHGSHGVAPALCAAVQRLITGIQGRDERVATILAPDDCGQEEVLALAATDLSRRHGETTLIVTASPDPALAGRLSGWLDRIGGDMPARLVDLSDGANPNPDFEPELILTDAETLSDSGLDRLRAELESNRHSGAQGLALGRVGLVVWWDAHEFSGVDAAHVWAVSRRLERLLGTRHGAAPRALIFARRSRDRESSFLGFLAHLLPYPQSDRNCHHIPVTFARHTHVYRLKDSSRPAVQKAVEASTLTGWPTHAPAGLAAAPGAKPLVSDPTAGASILAIRPHEVLSLREIICQGGRSGPVDRERHVAIAAGDNPYADFLLDHYDQHANDKASVNLIGAEGHADLIRRHLLLGLREVPDTFQRLRANFRWEEAPLRAVLDQLSRNETLRTSPVRSLSGSGHLQRDFLYENQNPGRVAIRSFRIVSRNGQRSVELRNLNVRDQLLLEVDPERLPLEAYPQRVFQSRGRSFRVQDWNPSLATPSANAIAGRVDCKPEENGIETWPFSTMRISQVRPDGEPLTFKGVSRYIASIQYSEDVSRVLERSADGGFKNIGIPTVRTSFGTKALMLAFTGRFTSEQMRCAAAALQYVVPVHTAVEDSALRVVPFRHENQAGLALVDLYPGGIGIVNAMHKDTWLMATIFEQVATWLRSVKTRAGMDEIANSPIFRTRNINIFDAERTLAIFDSTTMQPR